MLYFAVGLSTFVLGLLARRSNGRPELDLIQRLQLGRVREERGRWA